MCYYTQRLQQSHTEANFDVKLFDPNKTTKISKTDNSGLEQTHFYPNYQHENLTFVRMFYKYTCPRSNTTLRDGTLLDKPIAPLPQSKTMVTPAKIEIHSVDHTKRADEPTRGPQSNTHFGAHLYDQPVPLSTCKLCTVAEFFMGWRDMLRICSDYFFPRGQINNHYHWA